MNVYVVEAPGGVGDAYQCPHCSLMTPAFDAEKPEQRVDAPRKCKRCTSPMDPEKALVFGNEMAALAATPGQAKQRRVVSV